MRHLVDALGREWHVYERGNSAQAPMPGRQSLVFDTEGIVRRLWQYPRGWAELPDDALLGLMEDPSGVQSESRG
jgi:hypothetical protein